MKKYPFSVRKHAHDIEFRINRVWLEMHDMESGETPWDDESYEKMEKLHNDLLALRDSMICNGDGYVCYLSGKEIGLAKATVAWASNTRANTLVAAGKTQYLQYC